LAVSIALAQNFGAITEGKGEVTIDANALLYNLYNGLINDINNFSANTSVKDIFSSTTVKGLIEGLTVNVTAKEIYDEFAGAANDVGGEATTTTTALALDYDNYDFSALLGGLSDLSLEDVDWDDIDWDDIDWDNIGEDEIAEGSIFDSVAPILTALPQPNEGESVYDYLMRVLDDVAFTKAVGDALSIDALSAGTISLGDMKVLGLLNMTGESYTAEQIKTTLTQTLAQFVDVTQTSATLKINASAFSGLSNSSEIVGGMASALTSVSLTAENCKFTVKVNSKGEVESFSRTAKATVVISLPTSNLLPSLTTATTTTVTCDMTETTTLHSSELTLTKIN
jgi:hypothetical protein